jgi:hypothetical protein
LSSPASSGGGVAAVEPTNCAVNEYVTVVPTIKVITFDQLFPDADVAVAVV